MMKQENLNKMTTEELEKARHFISNLPFPNDPENLAKCLAMINETLKKRNDVEDC